MLKNIKRNCDDCEEKEYCENKRGNIYKSIRSTKRGFNKKLKVIGGDTETCNGKPITLQLYDETNQGIIKFVNKDDITDVFLDVIVNYNLGHQIKTALIWFHNLEFDSQQLLFPIKEMFAYPDFKLTPENCELCKRHNCKIDVKCNKVFFVNITFYSEGLTKKGKKRVKRRIYLRDSAAFMRGSLEFLSDELKLGQKIKKPLYLGTKKYTHKDDYFVRYAVNDAHLSYRLGKYLLEFNKEFDVPIACSAPNIAQKIFTKHFFPKNTTAWLPNKGVWDACCLSYHGGKNHFTLKKARELRGVYELDVNSMYPYAMINLPAWTSGKFEKVYKIDYENVGIYCITGHAKRCDHPIIPDHEFKYFSDARFEDVWVCSYELMEALRCDEIEIESVWGYVFLPDVNATNPFLDYVDCFYLKKKNCKGVKKKFYKLMANSLYGKFCQSICCNGQVDSYSDVERDEDGQICKVIVRQVDKKWRAGGLCHMFVATMITSFARAELHKYEHKYKSLDSSTDSIKTVIKPDISDLGEGIGQLSVKAYGHKAYLIRNKVYVFFNEMNEVIHYARHGFHGSIEELIELFENKKTRYNFERMIKLRESMKSVEGLKPFTMHEFKDMAFNVDYDEPDKPDNLEQFRTFQER